MAGLLASTGCGSNGGPCRTLDGLKQCPETSVCGGFAIGSPFRVDDFCASERLIWRYDATARELQLVYQRLAADCARHVGLELRRHGAGYRLVPLLDLGPSTVCLCDYGLALRVSGPPLRFALEIDGISGVDARWSGELDLSLGSGTIVLDDQPALFCTPNSLVLPGEG
ncbi:MAG: hypothetical protein KC609_05460 [Myxococcales bacterium]|nr:hypothetical protein [Myxococcales bacterium]